MKRQPVMLWQRSLLTILLTLVALSGLDVIFHDLSSPTVLLGAGLFAFSALGIAGIWTRISEALKIPWL